MKVYSIEKTEFYLQDGDWKIMHQNIWDVVSSKKKVIENLFYLGVTDQKGKTNKEWSMNMFPYEFYTKKFKIDKYEYKDIVTIKEWELY